MELDLEVVVVWYMNMIWHIVWNSQRIYKGFSYKNNGCKDDYLQCKKSLRLKCYNCCPSLKKNILCSAPFYLTSSLGDVAIICSDFAPYTHNFPGGNTMKDVVFCNYVQNVKYCSSRK